MDQLIRLDAYLAAEDMFELHCYVSVAVLATCKEYVLFLFRRSPFIIQSCLPRVICLTVSDTGLPNRTARLTRQDTGRARWVRDEIDAPRLAAF